MLYGDLRDYLDDDRSVSITLGERPLSW
jgi:hypothetical protein